MISLVICMLLMIIISLMTLSFATLSRREQRQALDKQLSTQAFYAAETGINDAAKALLDNPSLGDVTDCSDAEQAKINTGISGVLDVNSNVVRTCVLIDQTPSQINDVVGESSSTVFPISASGMATLEVYWENDSAVSSPVYPATVDPAGAFPADASWNNNTPGVLAIQLIPANFPTNRASIASGMKYFFGFPSQSNGTQSASAATPNGTILTGGCVVTNLPRQCKIIINNLSGAYYVRLKAFYDPVLATLVAKDAGGAQLAFSGAQVLIDATGRASDITKRVKIYKPLWISSSLPSSVLEIGDDLCKRLLSNPNGTTTDSAIPSCDPNTL